MMQEITLDIFIRNIRKGSHKDHFSDRALGLIFVYLCESEGEELLTKETSGNIAQQFVEYKNLEALLESGVENGFVEPDEEDWECPETVREIIEKTHTFLHYEEDCIILFRN
jgi:hypothetical protein